jgi:hypothetical protein
MVERCTRPEPRLANSILADRHALKGGCDSVPLLEVFGLEVFGT